MKKRFAVVPLLLIVTACMQSPSSVDPSVITTRSDAWEAALNAKDIDALADFYTHDVRLMSPNAKSGIGRDAVRAEFGAMIDAGLAVDLTSVETMVSGSMAHNIGTFVLTAGDEVVDAGKYVETWRLDDDGQWRISNDIYNSDGPTKAGEPKTHLMISHEVDDVAHWLAAWRGEDSRHKLFKENGAAHVHTFRSVDNPNLTGLVISVRDMGALQAMLESEEGMAAAAEDGVRRDTMKVLTEAE